MLNCVRQQIRQQLFHPFTVPISIQIALRLDIDQKLGIADRTSSATSRARVPRFALTRVIGIGLPNRPRAKSRMSLTIRFKRCALLTMRDAVPSCFSFMPSASTSDDALSKMELSGLRRGPTWQEIDRGIEPHAVRRRALFLRRRDRRLG